MTMKVYILTFISCILLTIEANPLYKVSSSQEHNREVIRELFCLLKGKTVAECTSDSSIDRLMDTFHATKSTNSEDGDLSSLRLGEARPPSAPADDVPAKRQAFYSDWK